MRLQDLPRPLARRCLRIPRFCSRTLGVDLHGASLVVAYSTGLDSTALLHLLCALRVPLGLTIVAAHAHHGLRDESDRELAHALATCARLGVLCETGRLDVPAAQAAARTGREDAARTARYAFLEGARRRHGADWIATAHHADDLAEDIVMRLVRGTGWPGLGGMPGADPARRLLRPVLDWEKGDLRAVLESTGTPWCEDLSNTDARQTRNRVRHEILPLLRRENPAFARSALNLWELARMDRDYWRQTLPVIEPSLPEYFLDAATLGGHQAGRLRLYKAVLDALGPGQVLATHLFLLDEAWTGGKIGRHIQFPGDKAARPERTGIRFFLHKKEI